jgi:hypothetical protein
VSGILAVTADPRLRESWSDCAARAGAYLLHAGGVAAARPRWEQAGLVLLGADQAPAAVRGRLPARGEVIVVGAGDLPVEAFRAADLLGATYVAVLPAGRDWLLDRLRPAGDQVLQRLRTAGFSVGYTSREWALDDGFVRPLDWRQRTDLDRPHPFVVFSDIARGECRAGQSTTVQRSNMRCLHRRFPGVFTDMVFTNVTTLGAFAADLSEQVLDVLCRLAGEYLVFDEDDLTELEAEEIRESWQQWAADDVRGGLGERALAVWDELDEDDRERLWWDTVTGLDAWPEHDGRTVRWRLTRLTRAYAARLTAEGRRRRVTARRAAPLVR